MDIGFTTSFSPTSTQFEVTSTPQNREASTRPSQANQTESIGPNQAGSQTNGTQNGDSEQPKSSTKNPTSAEARREAMNDPNSALYKQLQALKNRDREVRTHEQAHLAAAGPYALGGPTYQYQRGPDGQRYAVGGQVKIDTSEVAGNPEATLRKAETVRRAALAPAEPSSQDRRVAAQASSLAVSAQQELTQLRQEEAEAAQVETKAQNDNTDPGSTNTAEQARDKVRRGYSKYWCSGQRLANSRCGCLNLLDSLMFRTFIKFAESPFNMR